MQNRTHQVEHFERSDEFIRFTTAAVWWQWLLLLFFLLFCVCVCAIELKRRLQYTLRLLVFLTQNTHTHIGICTVYTTSTPTINTERWTFVCTVDKDRFVWITVWKLNRFKCPDGINSSNKWSTNDFTASFFVRKFCYSGGFQPLQSGAYSFRQVFSLAMSETFAEQ